MDSYSLLSNEDHLEMQPLSTVTETHALRNNRQNSRGSIADEVRVQFALSQTPPVGTMVESDGTSPRQFLNAVNTSTATHQTLSPIIQCFQNDK